MTTDLRIDPWRSIPAAEIRVGFARSGGPGGQNVNKVETKVELRWRPAETSLALTPEERARLSSRLSSRLTAEGDLVVTASQERSQARNREIAAAKLAQIVRDALARPTPRMKTRPSRAAKARRLEAKRRQGARKRERRARED